MRKRKQKRKRWTFLFTQKIAGAGPRVLQHTSHTCCFFAGSLCWCRAAARTEGFPALPVFFLQPHWHLGQVHMQFRFKWHQSFIQITSIISVLSVEVTRHWHTDISVHCSGFQLTLADSSFSLLSPFPIHFSFQTILLCGFVSSPSGYASLLKPDWNRQIQIWATFFASAVP